MEFDSRPVVVYGIRVANSKLAGLVKKVLIISGLAAIVVIVLAVLNFTILRNRTTVTQSIISLIVGLSIPIVGWFGAKLANRSLLGLFCSFSLSCGLFNLISYILVMSSAGFIDRYLDQCRPDGTVIIDGAINRSLCLDYTHSAVRDVYIIASCVSIPVIILQCLGGIYGNSLYSELTPGVIVTYNTEAYLPGQAYGGAPVTVTGSPIVTVAYPVPPSKGQGVYPQV